MAYRNPFSAGNAPKIPDGKCVQSLGVKKNATIPYDFVAEQTTVDIVLMPGLNNPLFMLGKKADKTKTASSKYGFASPNTRYTLEGFDATTGVPGANAKSVQKADHEVAKWRLVSGGLKIQSLTDCDDDGAWFEAFRFSPQAANDLFAPKGLDETVWVEPKDDLFGNAQLDSLSEKGNYFAGKLNQLGRYPMKLNEVNASHDFVNCANIVALEQALDMNMDFLYIRIHGKPAPTAAGTSCCSGTKLLLNLVMNYELVLAEQNVMHKLQTRTLKLSSQYQQYRGNFFPYYGMNSSMTKGRTGKKQNSFAGIPVSVWRAALQSPAVKRAIAVTPSPKKKAKK